MTITEFLLARIAEDEAAALAAEWVPDPDDDDGDDYDNPWSTTHGEFAGRGGRIFAHILRNNPTRVMAECAAKRAIIQQHEDWPVLVEQRPARVEWADDARGLVLRASMEIAWLTEREYVKRFGTEPQTAPMLRTLAAIYATHPDYDESWRS